MRDVSLRTLAAGQEDLFAGWQLRARKFNQAMIDHRVENHGWREIHRGVWTTQQGPLTRRQLLIAAVLTAPGTHLNAFSTGDLFGFHKWEDDYETVVRAGGGGPRRYPALLVAHSRTLAGNVMRHQGLPTVKPERALLELARELPLLPTRRAFREACRLGCTTPEKIGLGLRGQRGSRVLRPLCERYAAIPYHRCKSDAESRGLEVLHDAGVPLPDVNVRVAGREADFVWRRWKLIIEIDSKEFHVFSVDDADKEARWKAAGYTVLRIWANDVYYRPGLLLAMAVPPNVQKTHP